MLIHFGCSFVVLHAPCRSSLHSLEDVAAWWMETTTLLQHVDLAPLTWIFLDANAPLASHDCEFFETHGAEPTK